MYFVFLDLWVFVFSILYFWILAFLNLYFGLLDQCNFGIWISYLVFCILDFVFLDFGFSILNCLILDIGFLNLDFGCWLLFFFDVCMLDCLDFCIFWDFAFCDLDSGTSTDRIQPSKSGFVPTGDIGAGDFNEEASHASSDLNAIKQWRKGEHNFLYSAGRASHTWLLFVPVVFCTMKMIH